MAVKHIGFKAAAKKAGKGDMKKGGAIIASAARKASPAAKKKNPFLLKVKGKAKK